MPSMPTFLFNAGKPRSVLGLGGNYKHDSSSENVTCHKKPPVVIERSVSLVCYMIYMLYACRHTNITRCVVVHLMILMSYTPIIVHNVNNVF